MNRTLLLSFILLFLLLLPVQAQLQNVQPDIWLRGDQFNYSQQSWKDISGNNRHATRIKNNSNFVDSLMCSNPAVYFNGNNALQINHNPESADALSVIIAYQSKATGDQGLWRATMGDEYDAFLTTQRMMDLQSLLRYTDSTAIFPVINTILKIHDEPVEILEGKIFLGCEDNLSGISTFTGKIAECFVFYRDLSYIEKRIIQSYLALKYGITLQYSNYVDGDGILLWDYEQNKDYRYSIAGIGRDDSTTLYRKQSASIENDNFIEMAATQFFNTNAQNTSVIDNRNFIIWSDNGAALTVEPLDNPYLIARKWLMTVVGNHISNLPFSMKVHTNKFINTEPDSILYLAISRSGDNSFSDVIYIPSDSINSKGIAFFSNLYWDTDLSGSDLFTFAIFSNSLKTILAGDEQFNENPQSDEFQPYQFRLFPNPTSGEYRLQLNYSEKTDVNVKIYNSTGALVNEYNGSNSSEYLFIDYVHQSGIYFIHIETALWKEVMKLIKK